MRFKWIILQDEPLLANYDEDGWVAGSSDEPADVDALLAEIEAYGAETVRLLRAMPESGWARTGQHQALGTVVLEPYVRHEVAHEQQHLAQLESALG